MRKGVRWGVVVLLFGVGIAACNGKSGAKVAAHVSTTTDYDGCGSTPDLSSSHASSYDAACPSPDYLAAVDYDDRSSPATDDGPCASSSRMWLLRPKDRCGELLPGR